MTLWAGEMARIWVRMIRFINYRCMNSSNSISITQKNLRVRATKYDVQMISPREAMHSLIGQVLTSIILQLGATGSKSALANLPRSTNIISSPHLFLSIRSSANASEYSPAPKTALMWSEQGKSHWCFICNMAGSAVPRQTGEIIIWC